MEDKIIYHVTTAEEWNKAQDKGEYTHPSLVSEGFIHCSTEELLPGVMDRYFSGHKDLIKLVIDTESLLNPLRYETATRMNEAYPHIYGSLNLEAVTEVIFLNENNSNA